MTTPKILKENLKKSLSRVKKIVSKKAYESYENEIKDRKLLVGRKVKTLEKYIEILRLIEFDNYNVEYKGLLRRYKKKQKEVKKLKKELKSKLSKTQQELKNESKVNDTSSKKYLKKKSKFLEELKKGKNELSTIPDHLQGIHEINIKDSGLTIEDIIVNLLGVFNDQDYLININDTYYTLNDKTRSRLYNDIVDNLTITSVQYESDAVFTQEFLEADTIYITKLEKKHKNDKKQGGFFKYYHNLDIDLTRYQLFKKNDPKENYDDNCLLYALRQGGLNDKKYEYIKTIVKNREIPRCDLKEICKELSITIIINDDITKGNRYEKIGGYDEIYNIAEVNNHYFINEKVNYTSYSIENYHEIKHHKDFHKIISFQGNEKKYPNRREDRFISSYELIKILHENKDKFLESININNSNILQSQFYNKVDLIPDDLEYDDSCCRLVEKKEKKTKDLFNVYFDFETLLKIKLIKKNKRDKELTNILIQNPFLVCYVDENLKKGSYIGPVCASNFLRSLKNNTRLIAHNANFDYRFLVKHLTRVNEICRDNRLIKVTGYFNFKGENKYIEIVDSVNYLAEKLENFPKMFKMLNDMRKEVIPYDIYTEENYEKKYIPIVEALESIHIKNNEEKKIQFLKNIEEWKVKKGDTYNIIDYARRYCFIDCEILKQGYESFNKMLIDNFGSSIHDFTTISSYTHDYLVRRGCYEGVYELTGLPQHFISKSIVGGRTMCWNNEKQYFNREVEDDVMNIEDCTGLYPSAMVKINGFLKGKPKVLYTKNYDEIKNYDGYFVEIKITKIGKERGMPLLSIIDEDTSVRNFTNDLVGENIKNIYIDKTGLEDAINFQNIEFEIIKGYYFDEGFNTTICDVMQEMFNIRKKFKKDGNPIQLVYKLMLNSSYGKTIMKPNEYEYKIINNYKGDGDVFLSRNYNFIHSIEKNIQGSSLWKFKIYKSIDKHFNIPQVGSSILSMSKRIMNEVICLAEDLEFKIYYQDTDSIHIKRKDSVILKEEYFKKYGKKLDGKDLGQFHNDAEIDGFDTIDTYSVKSIFLGKKSYVDRLEGVLEDGSIITHDHYRLKGITEKAVEHTIEKINNNDIRHLITDGKCDVYKLYELLDQGNEIPFDLIAGGKGLHLKMHRDYEVETIIDFVRTLKF